MGAPVGALMSRPTTAEVVELLRSRTRWLVGYRTCSVMQELPAYSTAQQHERRHGTGLHQPHCWLVATAICTRRFRAVDKCGRLTLVACSFARWTSCSQSVTIAILALLDRVCASDIYVARLVVACIDGWMYDREHRHEQVSPSAWRFCHYTLW